jgi:hypothetical protein
MRESRERRKLRKIIFRQKEQKVEKGKRSAIQ